MNLDSYVLCESGYPIVVSGSGADATIEVGGDDISRFRCETRDLEDVLQGVPLQVSAEHGFLKIMVERGLATVEFAPPDGGLHQCQFPESNLREAVESIKGRTV